MALNLKNDPRSLNKMPSSQVQIQEIENDFSSLVYIGNGLKQGAVVHTLSGDLVKEPTRTSIQIGKEHIEDPVGAYVNHSCSPSCKVSQVSNGSWALIALQYLSKGDWITFDYRVNETKMASPFICHCCNVWIRGQTTSST
jgi:hypothetical protein